MKYNPYPRLLTRLFFGSIFLILGLISLLSYRNVSTKSLRDKGETLPSKVTNTGDYAIQITDVSGPEAELKGKDYFVIAVDNDKKTITDSILYGVVLSDGGNTIRIFEFETGNSDAYYDFTGKTNK